jgi:hypothetical protein
MIQPVRPVSSSSRLPSKGYGSTVAIPLRSLASVRGDISEGWKVGHTVYGDRRADGGVPLAHYARRYPPTATLWLETEHAVGLP